MEKESPKLGPNLTVIDTPQPPVRQSADIGHYFDQTVFDLQYTLLMARTRNMALDERLTSLGVVVDSRTGEVRLTALPDDDKNSAQG